MKNIKVIIVDDSVIYRKEIRAALDAITGLEVVAVASNGKFALDRLALSPVDLVILDLEMPEMDGLQTLREIAKKGYECKVLVFSAVSVRGAELTLEALRLGAADFIAKPGGLDPRPGVGLSEEPHARIRATLEPKIKALFSVTHSSPVKSQPAVELASSCRKYPSIIWDLVSPKIVVIGSSTGGPTVLEKIFASISGPLKCPIVIAQHMPPIFTATLAARLSRLCGVHAAEATHGERLEQNRIYIAPGDFHLRLEGTAQSTTMVLDQKPQINSVRPAVDPLFTSASTIFKERCLGFVLTGMGADGKVGAEDVKRLGGAIVIQSEASSVVFGMPGAVFAAGAYDRIASPEEIVEIFKEKIAPAYSTQSLQPALSKHGG